MTVVFDENGQTVSETDELDAMTPAAPEEGGAPGEEPGDEEVPNSPKYVIGDKTFATQAEALAYAQQNLTTLEREREITDAYRQGLIDAQQQSGASTLQNPQEPAEDDLLADFSDDEFYSNPKEVLKKVVARTKEQTLAEQQRLNAQRDQDAQVWAEFTAAHPEMADYRAEVTDFVRANAQSVAAIANTKGSTAAYAFVAGKLKEQFSRYAKALGERKVLTRGGTPSPSGQSAAGTGSGGSVTPKGGAKKPLSMAEQIRSIRKGRAQ